MVTLAEVIRSGDRADQPAANTVAEGTLFRVNDEEGRFERSDGSSWQGLNGTGVDWTEYSPTWQCPDGDAPSIGDGSLSGLYRATLNRDGSLTVEVRVDLMVGSTTDVGTGRWSFTLPVIGDVNAAAAKFLGLAVGISGGDPTIGIAVAEYGFAYFDVVTSAGKWGDAIPATAQESDRLGVQLRCQMIPGPA